jgi:succinate dehydrogenase / fumarate reductase flavoprotein subunit
MSKEKDERESSKTSLPRRGFLKGSGFAMGTAIIGSAALAGCGHSSTSPTSTSGGSTGTGTGTTSATNYKVVNADILYIGGGIGALTGIREAVKNGRKVTVLDKGPFRAGGASGMNWDVEYVSFGLPTDAAGDVNWFPFEYEDPTLEVPGSVTNKQLGLNAVNSDPNISISQDYVNNGGECFPRRNADGSLKYIDNYPYPYSVIQVEGGFPRHGQDELIKSSLVTVYDRTMVTNVVVNNGVCVGVTALHLPTGQFTVYTANAVILTSGGCCWFRGWETVAAHSMNSPDNTADVEMALYRQGVQIGDSEFGAFDFISCTPSGISYSFNAGLGGDGGNYKYFLDANGKAFLTDPAAGYDLARFELDRVYFQTVVAEYMANNPSALGPHGGIYVDTTNPAMVALMRQCYSRNIELWQDKFDIDPTKTMIEVNFEMYEHGGTPVVDNNLMTSIPGLFCSRGAGVFGEGGGTCQYVNARMGSYALRSALKYLTTAAVPSTINYSTAVTEFSRLSEILTRTSGGLRPHVVRQEIQKAAGAAFNPYRTAAGLQAAATELARIRTQDLPKQVCTDKSAIYNTEWKMAIENYNLINIAELSIQASLQRLESRGFFRPDYPTLDDTNWHCMLVGQQVGGQMTFTKKTLPNISWSTTPPSSADKIAKARQISRSGLPR